MLQHVSAKLVRVRMQGKVFCWRHHGVATLDPCPPLNGDSANWQRRRSLPRATAATTMRRELSDLLRRE